MSSEVATYPAGQFAVSKDDNGVARFIQAVKEHGVKFQDLPRLTVPGSGGKVWEISTAKGLEGRPEIDVVIALVLGNRKQWYAEEIDPAATTEKSTPPNCASNNGIVGVGNNSLGQEPQHSRMDHDCLTCRWNQWESDRKKRKGKDCKDYALVFAFLPHSFLPVVLKVTVSSLVNMREYMIKSLVSVGLDPWSVVTRLSLDPQQEGQLKWSLIKFALVKPLEGAEEKRFKQIREAIEKHLQAPPLTLNAGDKKPDAPAGAAAAGAPASVGNERTPTPAHPDAQVEVQPPTQDATA